jgi:hypothetical protein
MKVIMFAFLLRTGFVILKHITYIRFVLRCAAPIRRSAANPPFCGRNENQSNSMRPPDAGEFKKARYFKFVICASQFRCFVVPVEKERNVISDS